MTQNNERVALISKKELLEYLIKRMNGVYSDYHKEIVSDELTDTLECINNLSPISQNEQQEAVAYTDGEGDFITKEMYDEYLKLGFYTECIVPLYNSPPKQILDGWKLDSNKIRATAMEMLNGNAEQAKVIDTVIHIIREMINTSPTTGLTSETNTEVGE